MLFVVENESIYRTNHYSRDVDVQKMCSMVPLRRSYKKRSKKDVSFVPSKIFTSSVNVITYSEPYQDAPKGHF